MSCEYVRDYYGVPACVGRKIAFCGRPGIIAKDMGNYIGVTFDEDNPTIICPLHPTDGIEYLEMGIVRKMTRSQRRYQEYLDCADLYDSFAAFLGISQR